MLVNRINTNKDKDPAFPPQLYLDVRDERYVVVDGEAANRVVGEHALRVLVREHQHHLDVAPGARLDGDEAVIRARVQHRRDIARVMIRNDDDDIAT